MTEGMRKRKALQWSLVLLGAFGFLAAGAFFFIQRESTASEKEATAKTQALFAEPRPVLLETVSSVSIAKVRAYPGTVKASREALLSFRVSGPLMEVRVQPGDYVKKGQILMEIDHRDFTDRIHVLEAQLEGARATLENARRDLGRSEPLLQDKVISQAAHDATRSAYETAAAAVKNLKAQLDIARHQLEDSRLRAPFDGIVSTREVENHEMVSAGSTVLGILDISSLEMEANVPESDIAYQSLQQGMEGVVEFASLPEQRFAAHLKEWSSSPDPSTRTYKVTFLFPAPEGKVRVLPGMTGELFWEEPGDFSGDMSIPLSAVVAGADGRSGVWVYNAETASPVLRNIEIRGLLGNDRVSVIRGLRRGEQIVSAGAAFVTEDMKLRPLGNPQ